MVSLKRDFCWPQMSTPDSHLEETSQLNQKNSRVVKMLSEEIKYKCNQCSYVSSRGEYLKDHIKKHSLEHPMNQTEAYPCTLCGFESFSAPKLKVHMLKHLDERPFARKAMRKVIYLKLMPEESYACPMSILRTDRNATICIWTKNTYFCQKSLLQARLPPYFFHFFNSLPKLFPFLGTLLHTQRKS